MTCSHNAETFEIVTRIVLGGLVLIGIAQSLVGLI